jgi:hypothetical protein
MSFDNDFDFPEADLTAFETYQFSLQLSDRIVSLYQCHRHTSGFA